MSTRIHHVVAPLIFVLGVGLAFTPLGCGSSIPPAVSIPDDGGLARQLRSCAAEHEEHLGSTSQAISFDVYLDKHGDVDSVALREATFGDEELETCMAYALRTLTIEDLPMRLYGSGPRGLCRPSRGRSSVRRSCLWRLASPRRPARLPWGYSSGHRSSR
jgi:hypothetical protein